MKVCQYTPKYTLAKDFRQKLLEKLSFRRKLKFIEFFHEKLLGKLFGRYLQSIRS